MEKYPIRHQNHTLEEKSFNFFRNNIPIDWNINSVDRDYGQDLNVEICEEGKYKGLEFILQLKSSMISNNSNLFENQTFRISTFNYLYSNLRVVLLIKYIEEENEAYWILLKDVELPNQNQETFTIKLPRENKLTEMNWNHLTDYIRNITNTKLNSVR